MPRPRLRPGTASAAWAALLAAICLPGLARPAAARDVVVMLDRAQVIPYPAETETVVVGNPIIADVTMLRNTGRIILTGRGYGDTNLIFLDAHGAVLGEDRLQVREPGATVVVQRGSDRESYSCQRRCQPTIVLGDSSVYLQGAIKDVQARNGLASGAATQGGGLPSR